MRKLVSFILILTLIFGMTSFVAYAEAAPETHSLPAFIDFEGEETGRYYNKEKMPKSFFNISSYNYISENTRTGNKYLSMQPSANVSSKNLIMFEDFKFDNTAADGIQPTKLVVSFDAVYEKITSSGSSLMSTDYVHFGIANTVNPEYGKAATHSPMFFNLYYGGMEENNIGTLGYQFGSTGHGFVLSALNSHAYRDEINSGKTVKYTFVVDLSRNGTVKPTIKFYINDAVSPQLVYEGSAEVNSINSVIFGASKSCIVNIDNVNIFEVPNEKITFTGADVSGTNVRTSKTEITLGFSHGVISAADKYISVFKGEDKLVFGEDYIIKQAFSDGDKTPEAIKVVFKKNLEQTTTYTIKADKEYFGADGIATGQDLILTTFTTQSDPAESFDVLKTAGIRGVYGVSGIAMLAYFDGAPGEIYVAREITKDVVLTDGYPSYLTSCIAKVTDPNGNTAVVYDFAHMDKKGKEYTVFDITDNIPGIWTIQIMNGRGSDLFTIGFNDTDIWGIRGEKVLGNCSGLPQESWIYTPDTFDYLYVSTSTKDKFELFDSLGNKIAESEETTRAYLKQKILTSDLLPEQAYKIKWADNFLGNIEIDGVPGLFCPSREAAETLKGGWYKVGDVTVQGIRQKKAREEIIRLINTKDLTYTYQKPANMPETLKNPMAEAQLFGGYAILGGIDSAVQNQILDEKSPYLGLTKGEPITVPELNWQHGYFKELTDFANAANAMANVSANLGNLELNYLYGNDALIQRAAICLLGIITQLSEDDGLRINNLSGGSYVLMTGAMFTFEPMSTAYEVIRPHIDSQTREILDEGMMAICDKMGNYYGQGPTNQALFCMSMCEKMYNTMGIERYHDTFKRQIISLINNTDNQHGQADLGYFLEATACDASYEYMNRYHYYSIYKHYKNLPDADGELVSAMKDSIQKSLEFESFFWAPQPYDSKIDSIDPSCFTSRTDTTLGTDNYPGYSIIWDEFPLARRRRDMVSGDKLSGTGTVSYAHRINNEDWAYKQIKNLWGKYDKYFYNGYGLSSWTLGSYEAFNATEWVEPEESLPFEAADGTFWQKDGFVAFKHKGIYGVIFYGIDNSSWHETESLMGGGPTFLWGEGTGKTLVSKKHVGYFKNHKVESVDDIVSSCIYGTDSKGNLTFYSGKEGTTRFGGLSGITFNWNTYGKSFTISGAVPDGNATTDTGENVMSGKTVSWTYGLVENGLSLTATVSGGSTSEAYWLNLPIAWGDANISYDYSPGKLVVKNGSGSMTYSWDSTYSSAFTDEKGNVRRLRIRIPLSGRVTVNISQKSDDFTITEKAIYEDIELGDRRLTETLKNNGDSQYVSFRIRNNTENSVDAKLIVVHYEENGKFGGIVNQKEVTLDADKVTRIMSDKLDIGDITGTINAFLWTNDSRISPLVTKNTWTIEE